MHVIINDKRALGVLIKCRVHIKIPTMSFIDKKKKY